MPNFSYTVDDQERSTEKHEMTPREILTSVSISADNHYLVQITGSKDKPKESYQAAMDTPIHMHNNMKFISIATGPTPVS
jgi:hypothetical protein